MTELKGQILATTHVDAFGDVIPPEGLRALLLRMPDPWLLTNRHDESLPPVARAENFRLVDLDNGHLGIAADVTVLDEEAFAGIGGCSIAYSREVMTHDPERQPDVELTFPARQFTIDEMCEAVDLSNDRIQVNARELTQRGIETPIILGVALATSAFFRSFFDAAGKDAWAALRKWIKATLARRAAASARPARCQLRFPASSRDDACEVLVDVPLDLFDAVEAGTPSPEDLLRLVESQQRSVALRRITVRVDRERAAWTIVYCVTEEQEVLRYENG